MAGRDCISPRPASASSPVAEDHLDDLVADRLGGGGVLAYGLARRLLEMIAQQLAPGGPQGLLDGRDLGQDVAAGPVFFDHPLKPAHLALDAAQAVEAP